MITIDWATFVINVPREDLTLVQTTPTEIRELDLNWFRLQLKDIEDSEAGMSYPDTHRHNTEVSLGGITYARVIEILDPYSIIFENGQYAVNLTGANSNVGDKINLNQVSVRSNNSAGLISSPAIEFGSFNGSVTIDVTSPYYGTAYPRGTEQMPVNNLDDAKLIAKTRGFRRLKFLNDFTFTSGMTLNNFEVYGIGMQQMTLTFEAGADMTGTHFYATTCSGVILDPAGFLNCKLQNILFDSIISAQKDVSAQECILQTEIGCAVNNNNLNLEFLNCWSFPDVATNQPPRLNMNNSLANVNLRNHSGGLNIINNNKPNEIRVYLNSGRIQLDSSITAGNFLFIGVGTLVNHATAVTSIDYNGLVSKELVSLAVWDESLVNHVTAGTTGRALSSMGFDGIVWLDPINGISGTTYPVGTRQYPSNNGPDALLIANREGLRNFNIEGNYAAINDLSEITIGGDTFLDDGITFNNNNYNIITFKNLHLDGIATFNDCEFINCYIENIMNFSGEVIGGRISNNISVEAGKTFSGIEIVVEGDNTIIDLQNQPCTVSLDVNSGIITFINAVAGCLIELNLRGGEIVVDSSCVGGKLYLEGVGTLYNGSAMTILDNHLVALEPIADYVWNKTLP